MLQIPQGRDEKRGQMLYDKGQCASPSSAYLEILIEVERDEGGVKRAVKSRLWVCFRGFGCSFSRWPNETTTYTQAMILQQRYSR